MTSSSNRKFFLTPSVWVRETKFLISLSCLRPLKQELEEAFNRYSHCQSMCMCTCVCVWSFVDGHSLVAIHLGFRDWCLASQQTPGILSRLQRHATMPSFSVWAPGMALKLLNWKHFSEERSPSPEKLVAVISTLVKVLQSCLYLS